MTTSQELTGIALHIAVADKLTRDMTMFDDRGLDAQALVAPALLRSIAEFGAINDLTFNLVHEEYKDLWEETSGWTTRENGLHAEAVMKGVAMLSELPSEENLQTYLLV